MSENPLSTPPPPSHQHEDSLNNNNNNRETQQILHQIKTIDAIPQYTQISIDEAKHNAKNRKKDESNDDITEESEVDKVTELPSHSTISLLAAHSHNDHSNQVHNINANNPSQTLHSPSNHSNSSSSSSSSSSIPFLKRLASLRFSTMNNNNNNNNSNNKINGPTPAISPSSYSNSHIGQSMRNIFSGANSNTSGGKTVDQIIQEEDEEDREQTMAEIEMDPDLAEILGSTVTVNPDAILCGSEKAIIQDGIAYDVDLSRSRKSRNKKNKKNPTNTNSGVNSRTLSRTNSKFLELNPDDVNDEHLSNNPIQNNNHNHNVLSVDVSRAATFSSVESDIQFSHKTMKIFSENKGENHSTGDIELIPVLPPTKNSQEINHDKETNLDQPTITELNNEHISVPLPRSSISINSFKKRAQRMGSRRQLHPSVDQTLHEKKETLVKAKASHFTITASGISKSSGSHHSNIYHVHKYNKWVILPTNPLRIVWDVLVALFVLYFCFIIPYAVIFPVEELFFDGPFEDFNQFLDAFFYCDIILNFRTGFIHNGHIVTDDRAIIDHYVKGWLSIDILASFPFENFFPVDQSSRKAVKLWKIFKLSRLLRIGRIIKYLGRYFKFRFILMFCCAIILLSHWTACAWFLFLTLYDDTLYQAGDSGDISPFFLYADTLNDVVNQMLGVYEAKYALSTGQMFFSIFVTFLGQSLLGFLFASIFVILLNARNARERFRIKMENISNHMISLNLPDNLQYKVNAYYDYLWMQKKGSLFGGSILFEDIDLSHQLKQEVGLYLINHQIPLRKIKMFEKCSDDCLAQLAQKIQFHVFMTKDWICKKGERGTDLYLIQKGIVEVITYDIIDDNNNTLHQPSHQNKDNGLNSHNENHNPDNNNGNNINHTNNNPNDKPSLQLTVGAVIGEVALLTEGPRTASVRAVTIVEAALLSKSDLLSVFANYPEYLDSLALLAIERLELDEKAKLAKSKAAGHIIRTKSEILTKQRLEQLQSNIQKSTDIKLEQLRRYQKSIILNNTIGGGNTINDRNTLNKENSNYNLDHNTESKQQNNDHLSSLTSHDVIITNNDNQNSNNIEASVKESNSNINLSAEQNEDESIIALQQRKRQIWDSFSLKKPLTLPSLNSPHPPKIIIKNKNPVTSTLNQNNQNNQINIIENGQSNPNNSSNISDNQGNIMKNEPTYNINNNNRIMDVVTLSDLLTRLEQKIDNRISELESKLLTKSQCQ